MVWDKYSKGDGRKKQGERRALSPERASMTEFTIVGTGHRPQDIQGLGPKFTDEQYAALVDIAERAIRKVMSCYKRKTVTVVTGGALGWDMALADAALRVEGVKLHVMLPADQERCVTRWDHMPDTIQHWFGLNAQADQLTELPQTKPSYGAQLNWRNEQMLDQIQDGEGCVLAFWSGKLYGGTYNTICFTKERGLKCHNAYGL